MDNVVLPDREVFYFGHRTTFAPNFNKVKTSTNTIWGVHARADAAVRRCRRGGHGGRELTRSRFTHWVAWMVRGAALAMATTLSW